MSKWLWRGRSLEEIPDGMFGFVYKITYVCNSLEPKFYIGKKNFYSSRTKTLSKKESLEIWKGRGAKPKKKKVTKESDWRDYISSSKELQELIRTMGEGCFIFEIIDMATTNSMLSYLEAKYIFETDALTAHSFNKWVSIKIRRENL